MKHISLLCPRIFFLKVIWDWHSHHGIQSGFGTVWQIFMIFLWNSDSAKKSYMFNVSASIAKYGVLPSSVTASPGSASAFLKNIGPADYGFDFSAPRPAGNTASAANAPIPPDLIGCFPKRTVGWNWTAITPDFETIQPNGSNVTFSICIMRSIIIL